MTSGCVICCDINDVQVVSVNGRMVGLCGVHNNPAAIADLEKLNPSSDSFSTVGTESPATSEASFSPPESSTESKPTLQ